MIATMFPIVFKEYQIFDPIICFVAVVVVYNLVGIKNSSEFTFHNKTMFKDVPIRVASWVLRVVHKNIPRVVFYFTTSPIRVFVPTIITMFKRFSHSIPDFSSMFGCNYSAREKQTQFLLSFWGKLSSSTTMPKYKSFWLAFYPTIPSMVSIRDGCWSSTPALTSKHQSRLYNQNRRPVNNDLKEKLDFLKKGAILDGIKVEPEKGEPDA